jgi:NAD(P)-dependent dehydrogenase (short-subunit alcohol dehydrogenase family)
MTDDAGLRGRRVIVVGAAGALGNGIAQAAAVAGADVVGFDRAVPAPERQSPGVRYLAVDVLDDAAVGAGFDHAFAGAAPWAVLNVVGGFAGARPLAEFDPAELTGQLQLNLMSAALVTKHALRLMTAAGEGRVVHTASRAAMQTAGSGFAYSVSKLGVLHLVSMAAAEVREQGITVNAVVPGVLDTPANRAAMPQARHERWPSVAEVAEVYLFLASPAARLISGASIPVYGKS